MDFSGKTVLVTGASRRIGRAIALAFAHRGADLVVHYRDSADDAAQLTSEIRKLGRSCLSIRHDLADSNATGPWFRSLLDETDGIDVLVNSASEFPPGGYRNLDAGSIDRMMAIHLISPAAMIQAMYDHGRPGAVVNILDTRIADRDPDHVAYHLAKRSLFTLTRDLAFGMADRLRINGVAPGVILPPPGRDGKWLEGMKNTNPMGMLGNPGDVADAVLYLAGARFVTGQIIFVDGGRHLKGNAYGL